MKPAKILVMGVLAAAAWIADWILLKQSIYQGQSLTFVGWPTLATVLGITFLTFFFLINRNRIISLIVDVIIFAGYLTIMPKDFYVILGGGLFLVFLVLFEQRLIADEKSRQDFSVRRVMAGSISLTIYSLLLLIGLNVYHNTQTDLKNNPELYYAKLEQASIKAANRTVPYITQNFDEQLTDEQEQQISDMLARDAVNKINQSATQYEQFFPLILAVIVVGLLSTFSFLLRWATIFISWVIFRVLVLIGFFKLEKTMVEVQKLSV